MQLMKYSQGSVFRSEGTVLSVILSPLLTLCYYLSWALYSLEPEQVKCRMSPLLLVPCIYYGNSLKSSLRYRLVVMHIRPRGLSLLFAWCY